MRTERQMVEAVRTVVLDAERDVAYDPRNTTESRLQFIRLIDRIMRDLKAEGIWLADDDAMNFYMENK